MTGDRSQVGAKGLQATDDLFRVLQRWSNASVNDEYCLLKVCKMKVGILGVFSASSDNYKCK